MRFMFALFPVSVNGRKPMQEVSTPTAASLFPANPHKARQLNADIPRPV
jgi:hypothetical protein